MGADEGGKGRNALRALGRALHWVRTGGAAEPTFVDLGEFKAPPEMPLAPIERVVEEGHLIAASAVRMAVKNRLLVRALRDDREYDPRALVRVAKRQFTELAEENEEAAERLEREQRREAKQVENARRPRRYLGGRPIVERPEQVRGPQVYRLLAAALRATAGDDEELLRVVSAARDDAWAELGREVEARLGSGEAAPAVHRPDVPASATLDPAVPVDADYARERDQRMRALIDEDLAALAARNDPQPPASLP
ncbi:hypothetical protein [Cryobacterium tepidiphilum]|uniref:Asparagine synthase n=1 Tax=Cryobacterium tepidiphilum TaxID=2486026 RepID=A0A3M8LDN0_9MICO|nr:hypothetical protein [Cryobacterium tepidiphilum]RNE62588.1 hypothetical protein EEJ31_07070 [Cryobacterium tepidiphilum]